MIFVLKWEWLGPQASLNIPQRHGWLHKSRMPFVPPANVSDWPLERGAHYISSNETHELFLCMQLQSLFSYFYALEGCIWESFLAQASLYLQHPGLSSEQRWYRCKCLSPVLNAELKRQFWGWNGGSVNLSIENKVSLPNSCLFRHLISKLPHGSHLKTFLLISKTPMALNSGHREQFCVCSVLSKTLWHPSTFTLP